MQLLMLWIAAVVLLAPVWCVLLVRVQRFRSLRETTINVFCKYVA